MEPAVVLSRRRRRSAAPSSPGSAAIAIGMRAMRPISSLTSAAREIATTRDPSRRIPMPDADDEVAELARTLDQMLRELDAARGETEQMIQAQRDFVADASHELRTPLTSVLANLELLEERLASSSRADSEDREIVAGALGSSRRMRRLVSDLLLLARADAGRWGPRRGCDLSGDRRRRDRRGAPRCRRACARPRCARAGAGRGQSRRPSPPRAQPDRERRQPHTAGVRGDRVGARRRRRGAARGDRRRPRHPGWHGRPDLRPLRPRRRPRRHHAWTRARAWAWRSSRRSRSRTGATSKPATRVAGGARFVVRLPLDEQALTAEAAPAIS